MPARQGMKRSKKPPKKGAQSVITGTGQQGKGGGEERPQGGWEKAEVNAGGGGMGEWQKLMTAQNERREHLALIDFSLFSLLVSIQSRRSRGI